MRIAIFRTTTITLFSRQDNSNSISYPPCCHHAVITNSNHSFVLNNFADHDPILRFRHWPHTQVNLVLPQVHVLRCTMRDGSGESRRKCFNKNAIIEWSPAHSYSLGRQAGNEKILCRRCSSESYGHNCSRRRPWKNKSVRLRIRYHPDMGRGN